MSRGWQRFLELCRQVQGEDELNHLFQALLTGEERTAIGHRIEILSSLMAGEESQRELAARLGISIATVTRGSNNIKRLSEQNRVFLKDLLPFTTPIHRKDNQ